MRKNPAKRGRGTAWPQESEDMYPPPPGGLVSHCPTNSPHLSSVISLCTQVKCITAPLRIFCISHQGPLPLTNLFLGQQTRLEHSPLDVLGLPESAKKNTGHPVDFEFQINIFFVLGIWPLQYVWRIYTKNVFVYLKSMCNWMSSYYLASLVVCPLHISRWDIETERQKGKPAKWGENKHCFKPSLVLNVKDLRAAVPRSILV